MKPKKILSLLLALTLALSLLPALASEAAAESQVLISGDLAQQVAKDYLKVVEDTLEEFGAPYSGGTWEGHTIWYGCCGGYLIDLSGDGLPELVLAYSREGEKSYDIPKSYFRIYTWDGLQQFLTEDQRILASGSGRSWPIYSLRQTVTGEILQETWQYLDGPDENRYLALRIVKGDFIDASFEDVGAILSEEDPVWILGGFDYILFNNCDALLSTLRTLADNASDDPVTRNGTPSDWAWAEVEGAAANHLVPEDLLGNYQAPITREEFCRLIIQTLSNIYGPDFVESMEQNGQLEHGIFQDTDLPEILAAKYLGIVNGRGNGKFDPEDTITRQEAAAMLTRTARDNLKLTAGSGMSFTDAKDFSSWAVDGIDYISGLVNPFNGRKVMGGTGNGQFTPRMEYSREQAFCTVLRMYQNWEMKTNSPEEYDAWATASQGR